MFTTRLYNLQKKNPSTFAVMLSKRDRRRVSGYIKDISAILSEEGEDIASYNKLSRKLEEGHFSYSNNELSVMRAAITLNKYGVALSYFFKRYALKTYR
ncbi:hypothetical protein NXH67_14585 [Butyrivibrio sp. DSM 10294]|uniref:hypothetical protein n=2 Tax=unclassified Butyrivibrio TaxID=2639466 RepID=UPI0003B4C6A5|nr:hypothetical protein [Butyrivibrio sp. DSM 10294]MDC7294741.1 hypothetical protein [Butyrivibrio sp. DSM 10294]